MTPPTQKKFSPAAIARKEGVSPGTIFRWLSTEILDRAGNRVRLGHQKRGGRIVIGAADFEAFVQRLRALPGSRAGRQTTCDHGGSGFVVILWLARLQTKAAEFGADEEDLREAVEAAAAFLLEKAGIGESRKRDVG